MAISLKTPSEQAIKLACERAGLRYEAYMAHDLPSLTDHAILAHARDIERLEPHLCVDPVLAEAERIYEEWSKQSFAPVLDTIELAIRRGMEMKA